jgi:hypothetical protein
MCHDLNLDHAHPLMHEDAIESFMNSDPEGFVYSAINNQHYLALVAVNAAALKRQGIYEKALLRAFTGCRINNRHFTEARLQRLFELADRRELRSAGEPLPHAGPFVIYRGIAGNGRARRPHGFCWTSSLGVACGFALRFSLPNPTVLTATVDESEVLAYVTSRAEEEFIVQPKSQTTLARGVDEVNRLRLTISSGVK